MKTKPLKLAVFSLILAGSVCACDKKNEPIEISFMEYSLTGTSCTWKNIQEDYVRIEPSEVVIINSKEVLEDYIECAGESNYPEVDFSKYTLLLARGKVAYQDQLEYASMQQLSAKKYVMKVYLRPSLAAAFAYWQMPIIIDKIADDSAIELIVAKEPKS